MSRKDKKGRCLHTGEQQRQEDGLYLYRYTDMTGKRQTVYASDLPELRIKEKEIQRDLDDQIITDRTIKRMTLNDLFDQYMETKDLKASTRANYQRIWKNRVQNDLGLLKVVQLRKSHIKRFYTMLSRAGYSHSMIHLIHIIILPTLELAVDDDIIRKNPAKGALSSECGAEAREKMILTEVQQNKLLAFIEESNVYNIYMPMLVIMLELGLRCGEVMGLRWSDLYVSDHILTIDHQLIYKNYGDGCKFHISQPKTVAGIRNIPLTKKVLQAFSKQREINMMLGRRCDVEIEGYTDFIFVTKNNRPYMPYGINNMLYNMVDAYNKEELAHAKKQHRKAELLPKISAHCLRHTACTNMARNGMNIKVIQYILGHSDSSVTMDVYNHLNNNIDIRNEVLRIETNLENTVPNLEKKVQ